MVENQRIGSEKRFLLNLLCSNFSYDGSKLIITIKESFKALIKFIVFVNGQVMGQGTNHNMPH